MLVDTHCHFNSLPRDKLEVIAASLTSDYCFVDASIDPESAQASLALSRRYDFIYTALGFHPLAGQNFFPRLLPEYAELIAQNKRIVAIGEIGLDYTAEVSLAEQEQIFDLFVGLAEKKDLPVIIHNRLHPLPENGADDLRVLDILDRRNFNYRKAVFHCFSYSTNFLSEILKRGGFVSFSLNILRNKEVILSSLKACPLESLLLETDSPYMKIKNEPSTPLNIRQVYSRAAEIKNIAAADLEDKIFDNIRKLFGIFVGKPPVF